MMILKAKDFTNNKKGILKFYFIDNFKKNLEIKENNKEYVFIKLENDDCTPEYILMDKVANTKHYIAAKEGFPIEIENLKIERAYYDVFAELCDKYIPKLLLQTLVVGTFYLLLQFLI